MWFSGSHGQLVCFAEPSSFSLVDRVRQQQDGGHGRHLEPDCEIRSDLVHSTCFCAEVIQVGDVNTHPGIFFE